MDGACNGRMAAGDMDVEDDEAEAWRSVPLERLLTVSDEDAEDDDEDADDPCPRLPLLLVLEALLTRFRLGLPEVVSTA